MPPPHLLPAVTPGSASGRAGEGARSTGRRTWVGSGNTGLDGASLPLSRRPAPGSSMPWMCWQTNSLALVSLAAMDADPLGSQLLWRTSPADVDTTLRRLLGGLASNGWPVFTQLQVVRPSSRWLVLGASRDTTAVIQRDEHAAIELPLAIQIVATSGGRALLRWHDPLRLAGHGLPDALLDRVQDLSHRVGCTWH